MEVGSRGEGFASVLISVAPSKILGAMCACQEGLWFRWLGRQYPSNHASHNLNLEAQTRNGQVVAAP